MTDTLLAQHIAERFHKGQTYGKQPYTYHLNMVAQSVVQEPNERLQAVAWLHDIIEDTSCTEQLLLALFEDDIVEAVVAISKVVGENYTDYIARVKANPLAKTVKMHDTKCNLEESLIRRDMKRVVKYAKQMMLLAE